MLVLISKYSSELQVYKNIYKYIFINEFLFPNYMKKLYWRHII